MAWSDGEVPYLDMIAYFELLHGNERLVISVEIDTSAIYVMIKLVVYINDGE